MMLTSRSVRLCFQDSVKSADDYKTLKTKVGTP